MRELINFSNCDRLKKGYGGANGQKIAIKYEGEQYMLKFPSLAKLNNEISYANGCISEYLGCHIFQSVGISVQDTLLGVYVQENGKEKLVVACKDLTIPGIVLQDFASLKNTIIDSERNGYGTELFDIEKTIDEQNVVSSDLLRERFWDVFIIDSLLGNWDRHNGNWGFLYNQYNDTMSISPVYDCGSSLFPQADEKTMREVLDNHAALNIRIFERPLSAIMIDGKKINYHKFISSLDNDNCNKALERMVPLIDMYKIGEIIDNTPTLSELQSKFYKAIITDRMVKIITLPYLKHVKNIPERLSEAKSVVESLSKYIYDTFDKEFIEREFREALNMFHEFIVEQNQDSILITFKNVYNFSDQTMFKIENGFIVSDILLVDENGVDIEYQLRLLEINKNNPFDMVSGMIKKNIDLLKDSLEQMIETQEIETNDFHETDDWEDR